MQLSEIVVVQAESEEQDVEVENAESVAIDNEAVVESLQVTNDYLVVTDEETNVMRVLDRMTGETVAIVPMSDPDSSDSQIQTITMTEEGEISTVTMVPEVEDVEEMVTIAQLIEGGQVLTEALEMEDSIPAEVIDGVGTEDSITTEVVNGVDTEDGITTEVIDELEGIAGVETEDGITTELIQAVKSEDGIMAEVKDGVETEDGIMSEVIGEKTVDGIMAEMIDGVETDGGIKAQVINGVEHIDAQIVQHDHNKQVKTVGFITRARDS